VPRLADRCRSLGYTQQRTSNKQVLHWIVDGAIPKNLTRDEFPFASTRAVDFETGEVLKDALPWVGHVPAAEALAQRNLIGRFYRQFGIGEGDRFVVKVVNFPAP
jgi:hypothetical protein